MKIDPLSEQAAQSWRDVGVHELQGVITFTVSSELTRGSLIRLQQSDNGRVALGTFNELLQRQSACGGEKKMSVMSSTCSNYPQKSATDVSFEMVTNNTALSSLK